MKPNIYHANAHLLGRQHKGETRPDSFGNTWFCGEVSISPKYLYISLEGLPLKPPLPPYVSPSFCGPLGVALSHCKPKTLNRLVPCGG